MDVIPLTDDRIGDAGRALARALFDDPLHAYVYPDLDERRAKGPEHFAVLARAATMFGEPTTTPDVAGAALCMPPGGDLNAERAQAAGFPRLWQLLGPDGIGRLVPVLDHVQGLAQAAVPGDNWYVMAIGVAPEHQSRGIGAGLLQPMIARADAGGAPCYLESFNERNVPFYLRLGFEVVVHDREPSSGLAFWTMLRAAR